MVGLMKITIVLDLNRELKQELQDLRQNQQEAQRQLQELKKTIRENEQQKKRAQTQLWKIQASINQLSYVSRHLRFTTPTWGPQSHKAA